MIRHGTQHCPTVPRNEKGVPTGGAGTLALIGDLKGMDPRFIRGASLTGYGPSLSIGIGVPIPVLDESVAQSCAISDAEIVAPVWDYSEDYPELKGKPLAMVSYAALRSGKIEVGGKSVETASLSSMVKAREIAAILKGWIAKGGFLVTEPVELLPGPDSGVTFKPLTERPIKRR